MTDKYFSFPAINKSSVLGVKTLRNTFEEIPKLAQMAVWGACTRSQSTPMEGLMKTTSKEDKQQ
jgi:hypothetical protein